MEKKTKKTGSLEEKSEISRALRRKIVEAKAEGLTYDQIADRLGVSRCVVGGHLRRERLGEPAGRDVASRHFSQKEDGLIIAMAKQRVTCGEISKLLNRNYDSVRKRAKLLGVVWNYQQSSSKLINQNESTQRKSWENGDKNLLRALAMAFVRGDHLPDGGDHRKAI